MFHQALYVPKAFGYDDAQAIATAKPLITPVTAKAALQRHGTPLFDSDSGLIPAGDDAVKRYRQFCKLYLELKNSGVLATLDTIQGVASNSADALLNLVSESFDATLSGSPEPSWTGAAGFLTNGVNYYDTGFKPVISGGAQTKAQLNSMSVTWFQPSETETYVGRISSGPDYLRADLHSTGGSFRVNSADSVAYTSGRPSSLKGVWTIQRISSTTVQVWLNNEKIGEETSNASVDVPASNFAFGKSSTIVQASNFMWPMIGAHLEESEIAFVHGLYADLAV